MTRADWTSIGPGDITSRLRRPLPPAPSPGGEGKNQSGKDVFSRLPGHVCQLTGSSRHAAIGTDLDGGYGKEQSPSDLDTIADLRKIPAILEKRGYPQTDVADIMHGNWVRLLRAAWK